MTQRNEGRTNFDTVIATTIITLLLILLATCALAQDNRWRLLPPGEYDWMGGDTAIVAPLPEIREAAGLRVSDRARLRVCAWKMSALSKESEALRKEREALREQLRIYGYQLAAANGRSEKLERDLVKAQKRSRIWVPVGCAGITRGVLVGVPLEIQSR